MELEHLNKAELAELRKESPRASAHAHAETATQPLHQLQHGLGNRALGRLIQAKYADGGDKAETSVRSAGADLAAMHDTAAMPNSSSGDGRPLGEEERAFFESRFREDFGGVRLHTGAEAAESARSIGARAYATGPHVVFADGQYAPHTESGLRLMAHELAHVVQQRRPGGGASPEAGAHAASEALAHGHAVSPQAIGSAAPGGLYADNGFSLTPALSDSSMTPTFGGFKLPPLKIRRQTLLFLITNGLLTTEMQQMLLRGEIVVEEGAPTAASADKPGEAGKSIFNPRSEFDDLLRRVTTKLTAEQEMAARLAPSPGPSPYAEQEPIPLSPPKPDPKKLFEFKGLVEGLDINIPRIPIPMNLSVSGLTLDVLKRGQFDAKLVAGLDQSLEVQLTYRDWHLKASIDMDGKWLMKLSYPNDSPMPVMGSVDAIFQQGERALVEALKTFKKGPGPEKLGELKDRISTLAAPIKNAVDAAQGISKVQRGVNVSVVVGAGPAPGNLPPSALEGVKQPATPSGFYAGFQLSFQLF